MVVTTLKGDISNFYDALKFRFIFWLSGGVGFTDCVRQGAPEMAGGVCIQVIARHPAFAFSLKYPKPRDHDTDDKSNKRGDR